MLLTFLGTGDAAGVPVYGCTCPICTKAKSVRRFRRLPCSALLEIGDEHILIDAGRMDIAERFPVGTLSRIFLTHYHMDHIQGLFHLRWGCNTSIPVYGPNDANSCGDLFKHPGILDFSQVMKPFEKQSFGDIHVTPVPLNHSKITLGYCFSHNNSKLAYLCDTSDLPPTTFSFLQNWQPDHIVLDCTHPPQDTPPHNHNDYSMVLNLTDKFKSSSFWLTHINHTLDLWFEDHLKSLPDNVQIARDNMAITIIKTF